MDDTAVYIENPKITTSKLLELINEFGKVVGYRSNIQRYVAFLYTNNKLSEDIPFKIASKRKKYLGINLTKKVQNMYSEVSKTRMRDVDDDTTDGKITSQTGIISIVKKILLLHI